MKQVLLLLGLIAYQASAQCETPLITDFECDPPSQVLPGTIVSIPNAFSGGINTSANIGQYTDNGNEPFDGLIIDFGTAIDLMTAPILQMKLYSATSIQVLAKLEGGTAPIEIFSDFVAENTWQELNFDFQDAVENGNTTLVLFFNPNVTTGNAQDLYYIDDFGFVAEPTLNVQSFTGVDNELMVYPNPTNEQVTIQSEIAFDNVTITDVNGAELLSENQIPVTRTTINTSALATGLYFATIRSGKDSQTVRISKQ